MPVKQTSTKIGLFVLFIFLLVLLILNVNTADAVQKCYIGNESYAKKNTNTNPGFAKWSSTIVSVIGIIGLALLGFTMKEQDNSGQL